MNNKYITTDSDGDMLDREAIRAYLEEVIDPFYLEDVKIWFENKEEGFNESASYFFNDDPDLLKLIINTGRELYTEDEVEEWARMEMSYYLFSKPDEFPLKNKL